MCASANIPGSWTHTRLWLSHSQLFFSYMEMPSA